MSAFAQACILEGDYSLKSYAILCTLLVESFMVLYSNYSQIFLEKFCGELLWHWVARLMNLKVKEQEIHFG